MRILMLIAMITKVTSKTIICDGIIFNDVYYKQEVLFTDIGKPINLFIHKFSGVIFFSHTITNGTSIDFAIRSCHIDSRVCNEVKGLPSGYAIGYDAQFDEIFMGGSDGIYQYNFITKTATPFGAEDKNIWALYVNKNFYYIQYPSQKLYVLQEDGFFKVAEATKIEVEQFFISRDKSVYYSNKTALYKVELRSRKIIVLNDDIVVRQIAEDKYGDVYFCASNGIYVEDKPYRRIKCLAKIDDLYGLTFDELDRVIYSDATSIYRLDKSNYSKLCYEAIRGKIVQPQEPVTTVPLRGNDLNVRPRDSIDSALIAKIRNNAYRRINNRRSNLDRERIAQFVH
ncbi:ommochrome-binding protein-like isoform X1 [Plodia interpunctella]|uniref:ommochrome-binding protein-like isoform X1 n=1 Tax=Plodia interpunctella TaxID=58824 RepID=UPI002367FCF5|nr:ommochrome-binding protein-like isoform X1 [Plodia interpunctella]XP_053619703.1 ommochrome-binding protein-like isoform X1 [Plodia interpunctella]XP_053619704.1 ommochrome-binding protein-like isoform X1 [Plodia interpunctella]XP_053619705.1 ommochrome-binding protein-like isoform X1 [Plodia interpunctella]